MSSVQKLGGTVILGCVVEPPWVNVTWRFNGKELNGSDDALGVLVTRGTLVIAALNNHTVGRYQCVARMPAGAVASVPATVTLASECTSWPLCVVWSHLLPFSLFSPPYAVSHSIKGAPTADIFQGNMVAAQHSWGLWCPGEVLLRVG